MYLSYFGACYRFSVAEGRVLKEELEALVTNNHEEADTLICHTDRENASNIVVRVLNSDVAVILLSQRERFKAHIWMETGTLSKNNRRFIDITAVGEALETTMCQALLGFHAYNCFRLYFSILQKGKEKSYQNP